MIRKSYEKTKNWLLTKWSVASAYNDKQAGTYQRHNLDNLPLFSLLTADLMLRDPHVMFGLLIRNGALTAAEVEITGNAQHVAFIQDQWDRIWNNYAAKLLRAKRYGAMPFEVQYKPMTGKEFQGFVGVDSLHEFHPRDARVMTRKECGEIGGVKFRRLDGVPDTTVPMPGSLWVTFDSEYGNNYGRSINWNSYSPWWEKWMPSGSKDVLRLRMIRDGYSGDVFWVPDKMITLADGTKVHAIDIARQAQESRLAGSPMTLIKHYDSNNNETSGYTPPSDNGKPDGILEWNDRIDWDIWKGQGVVREVFEAASSGSGFSGRSIPMMMFLGSVSEEFKEVLTCVDRDILRPMCHINFGCDPDYEIHAKPLTETFADDMQGNAMGGGVMGGPASGQGPGGGGGPGGGMGGGGGSWTQSQGPRGGTKWTNNQSGAVVYSKDQPGGQFSEFDESKHVRDEEGRFASIEGKSHSIQLPKQKKRITIDQASAALKEMGFELGKGDYDLEAGETRYLVTGDGKKMWLNAKDLRDMVYEGYRDAGAQFSEDFATTREYSCLMAPISGDARERVLALGRQIDPGDLCENGLELNPHVTVLYGIHSSDPAETIGALATAGPLAVKFSGVDYFSKDDCDVVHLTIEGDSLRKLHERLASKVGNTQTHPEYHPHVTIAYVKRGTGEKYKRELQEVPTDVVGIPSLIFSGADGSVGGVELAGPVQFREDDPTPSDLDKFINRSNAAASALIGGAKSKIASIVKKKALTPAIIGQIEKILRDLQEASDQALSDGMYAAEVIAVSHAMEDFPVAPPVPPVPGGDEPIDPPSEPPPTSMGDFDPDGEPVVRFPEAEAALEAMRDRPVMTGEDYRETAQQVREGAFSITTTDTEETVEKIREVLAENLERGPDAKRFVDDVNGLLDAGSPLSEARLHQIHQINMATAYSEAQEKALRKPLMADFFPYRGYAATSDQAVRDEHFALEKLGLNGTAIYNADDPVWLKFRPPWDYGCRCAGRPVSVRQAARAGVVEAQQWLVRAEALHAERGEGTVARYLTETAPESFEFVTMPPFEPSPGFVRP